VNESGAVAHDSRPEALTLRAAFRSLRDRAGTVLPGLYAWLTTIASPAVGARAPGAARVTAFLALVTLLAAPLFVNERPRLGRALGVFAFVGLSVLTWVLLGATRVQSSGDPLLPALGAVAFTLYALGWGSLRRRDVVPEDGPNVIPGPPLQPRARPHRASPVVFGVILVCSLVPVFLAFRVTETERGLFAHAAAILAAVLTITVGSRVAVNLGQRRAVPSVTERLNGAAVPLALLALLFGAGFLWLVVR